MITTVIMTKALSLCSALGITGYEDGSVKSLIQGNKSGNGINRSKNA